jgi:TPP-dependent pyruvate/acetoin dehydrogenase alpha subunit
MLSDEQIESLQDEISAEVSEAIHLADNDPHPALEERFDDVLAETYPFERK